MAESGGTGGKVEEHDKVDKTSIAGEDHKDKVNQSVASGPYPSSSVTVTGRASLSPRLGSKLTTAKGKLSAIKSSLRRDVEGIKSSMRKATKTEQSRQIAPESATATEMPAKKSKKNKKPKGDKESKASPPEKLKNKTSAIVRRLSIGKYKSASVQPKEFDSDLASSASTSISNLTPTTTEQTIPTVQLTSSEVIENVDSEVDPKSSSPLDSNLAEFHSPLRTYSDNLPSEQPEHRPPQLPESMTSKDPELDETESCDEEEAQTEDRRAPHPDTPAEPNPPMPPYGELIIENTQNENTYNTKSSSMIEAGAERREHLYKILVIGELGTGKTSIIKRYVHQFFSQHYRATIGVDFALKVLNWDANTIIRLQLWDIAGQERFGNMTRVYYKEAVGAFIVFDVTRVATFGAVVKWKQDLDSKVQLSDGSPIPCILLANKCDQQKEGLVNTPSRMDEYCKENGFAGWYETSAKENINIEEAARTLVNKILVNDKLMHGADAKKDTEVLALDGKGSSEAEKTNSGKSCAC